MCKLVEFVGGKCLVNVPNGLDEPGDYPVIVFVKFLVIETAGNSLQGGIISRWSGHLAEAASVPEFVTEVAADSDALFAEADILALRSNVHDAEAQAVRPEFIDEVERLGRITQGLGYFAPLIVADDSCEVNIVEGNALGHLLFGEGFFFVPHKLEAGNNHARNPEEDNIRRGNQVAGGVKECEVLLFLLIVIRPAHGGERPQPG